jgi:hypothetical protein
MKRTTTASLFLAIACAIPATAQVGDDRPWAFSFAAGLADQVAIGGAPTVSVELERYLTGALSVGVRSGYFNKDDFANERQDTFYGVLFARATWRRPGFSPFVEGGGGRYEFDDGGRRGYFGGAGAEGPQTAWGRWFGAARYHSVERPRQGPLPDFKEAQVGLKIRF